MGTNTRLARETRIQASLLAGVEKRLLIWMAERLPAWVGSDHLTALGAVAMLGAGLCFWWAARHPLALIAVVILLVLNWFGDSLDGTLARVRHHERPRYGFYVDHVLDVVGILLLFSGLVAGGFMTPIIGAAFLIAYYLLTMEIAPGDAHGRNVPHLLLEDGPDGDAHSARRRRAAAAPLVRRRALWPPVSALRRRRRDCDCRAPRDVRGVGDVQRPQALPVGTAASKDVRSAGENDRSILSDMILVAVDDFLFRSKIRTIGKQAGVELTFPKTPDEIIEQARVLKPSLVIFDLNSAKMEPIDTIVRMKQDPELRAIRTMGFVSHVDAARIQAARAAGADEVLARSAFATQLADILLAHGTAAP